jgi:PPOX class probable F420-dependent enzyme
VADGSYLDEGNACAWLADQRVARLATADANGAPHVVPVCFTLGENNHSLYVTVDEKPKSRLRPLKRIRNIWENPRVALVADRYDEDWSRLGWVMAFGQAELLASGIEHDMAQRLLRAKYPQYRQMNLESLPVIAVRIERIASWGTLTIH